ncbi:EAL domain-containing protein [Psychromonas aquimarina]|uniref:EAL domain-containing protein n=1 Tax=Psychromonas aquimarina TaxID=444919 RepID=UPI0003F55D78|nr:EAL domain-containing protein [Psychromonas aquimarina]
MPHKYKQVFSWFLLAGIYFTAAKFGLSLAFEQVNTSPVWPPTGIAIAALLLYGRSNWPGITLGAFLVSLSSGLPLPASVVIGLGNTFEALAACWLLVRYTNRLPFNSIKNVAFFTVIVFVSTMISALFGVMSLFLSDIIPVESVALLLSTWWLGDVVGGLVVTPFLVTWLKVKKSAWRSLFTFEVLLLLLVTALSTAAVFSSLFSFGNERYPLAFIYLPIAIWIGYRFHHHGTTLYIICVSSFAVFGTLNGFGPFVRASENESLVLLQVFMGIMMTASLALVASIEESQRANAALAASKRQLLDLVAQQSGDLLAAGEQLKLAESVFNESVESIVITDKEALILRVNPAFCRVTGYSSKLIVGRNPRFLQSGRHDHAFYLEFWETLLKEDSWKGEIWNRRKNGDVFPAWQTVSAVRDKTGNIIQFISIFSDISEKKVTEERIYHLAHYDIVTGLHNRSAFYEQMKMAIAGSLRHKHKLALLYLDLDNFKLINDASGHATGDLLLKFVADRLRSEVRKVDIIARLGGDEFVVLLTDIQSNQDVLQVAEKILKTIASPILLDHTEVVVTSSIGISTFPADGEDADTLLKNADAAMYRAKKVGRNTAQFFTAEMNAQAQDILQLENNMRYGIDKQEFILHYQPQISVTSGKIIGCEALIRWRHPERGLLFPDAFIGIAEQSGLIKQLGSWILHEACRQQVEWRRQGMPRIRIAVNISSKQFFSQQLIEEFKQVFAETGADPQYLEIELTESTVMENVEDNIIILQHLHKMGVLLAIDDFGTGYSSMAYLKRFPIGKLKIDRSFVQDLASDPDDAAIVTATTLLAHSLHMIVIAEGVENKEQLQFLKEVGCNEIQGYLFSKAVAPDKFFELVKNRKMLTVNF